MALMGQATSGVKKAKKAKNPAILDFETLSKLKAGVLVTINNR